MYTALARHTAHEVSKTLPTVAIVGMSWFLEFPWGVVGAFIGCIVGLATLAHIIWAWRREARAPLKPKPTVPPANGS